MANIRCSKFHAKDEKKQKERKVQHQARPYQLALLSQAIHVPGLLESSAMESRAVQQNEGFQMEQAMTQTDDNDPQPQAKRKISRAVKHVAHTEPQQAKRKMSRAVKQATHNEPNASLPDLDGISRQPMARVAQQENEVQVDDEQQDIVEILD